MRQLSESGNVMIVTAFYPPIPGGTSVIIKNLLKGVNSDSYTIFTNTPSGDYRNNENNVIYGMHALPNFYFLSRFETLWQIFQYKFALRKLIKLCISTNVTKIIGIYPDYLFLKLAYDASKALKLPLFCYLHDTIAEGLDDTQFRYKAISLQEKIFKESIHIWVMSEGMKNLYLDKYNLHVDVLEHSYPEKRIEREYNSNIAKNNLFWGGAVYRINKNSLKRVFNCAANLNMEIEVAANISLNFFNKNGFQFNRLKITNYTREEYIKTICVKGILVLALDWPEESPVHKDELATIFPTKTIEYLHSGRPILIHCPDNYFLAQFFLKYDCGLVISSRDINSLEYGIKSLSDDALNERIVKNAISASKIFDHERIQNKFIEAIK